MPGMPRCCSCESGNAPRAISVVTTGIRVRSAKRQQLRGGARLEGAATDVEHRALGPADQRHRAGDGVLVERRPRVDSPAGRTPRSVDGYHQSIIDWVTSLGTSISTGPGRPVVARWNAAATARGISWADFTRKLCLVMPIVMPVMSHSWKASVPIEPDGDLTGDHDQRRRVHVGVADRRDDVGGARGRS